MGDDVALHSIQLRGQDSNDRALADCYRGEIDYSGQLFLGRAMTNGQRVTHVAQERNSLVCGTGLRMLELLAREYRIGDIEVGRNCTDQVAGRVHDCVDRTLL